MPKIPAVTAKEMAELDRRLVEEFHIDLPMMMENAGRALSTQARAMMGGVEGKKILVMAGKGNNGGGGMAAARHLHNWGADVEIALATPVNELKELPRKQFSILGEMRVRISLKSQKTDFHHYSLIIDSLLGYGQHGNPRGTMARLVRKANSSKRPILCLDIPSGLNSDSGTPNNPCIRGTRTLTLALPKKGLLQRRAKPYVGDIFLADIGVPISVYQQLGVKKSIFAVNPVVKLGDYS